MEKHYTWSKLDHSKIFRGSGFPTHCPECDSVLESNDDYNYASDWWASFTCTNCKIKIKYMPTDMGQTLPQLVQYK